MSGSVAVAGAVAQRPGYGGHAWVFLQYLLGLRRLGLDVLFLDRLVDGAEQNHVPALMERFGLGDAYCVLDSEGGVAAGLSREGAIERLQDGVLLNVMGYLDDPELLAAPSLRVFVDIDPGFGQMWRELGLADVFAGHDRHVTIAERIGAPDCGVPTCGVDWITTRPPVVLSEWPATSSNGGPFATIGSWRGPYGPVEYKGTTFGLRVHEFRHFTELPRRADGEFELALDIDPADEPDRVLLAESGWRLVDPAGVAADPLSYRAYVRSAKAEFMVAKSMYVHTRSGWFSDRSVCFLASGKPVLAQDTGLRDLYPSDAGLLLFETLEEAVEGVDAISADYTRHARAARALAEERFDSDVVLPALLEKLGVT